MDDDDIFNSITGGTSTPVQIPSTQTSKTQQDDPFGLLSFGSTQPQTQPIQPQSSGFDMGLLGFGGSSPQPAINLNQQQIKPPQNNGGFSLLGEDFLGMGSTQPVQQPVNNFQTQNTGFSFNQPQTQPQGFNWGVQPQQNQQVQPQQNTNKFLAYENSQIQIWMNTIK